MIISTNGNIYEFNALSVLALYGELIEAEPDCTLGIISSSPLPDNAQKALSASAERLGFGTNACAWIQVTNTEENSEEGLRLGSDDLYAIIEGLDPVALVATDSNAAAILGSSYSADLQLNKRNRIMCRTAIAFSDFVSMLESEDAKQLAWHLLKELK